MPPPSQQAEFLAEISHDIRTPLNAIMGYAEMLSKTSLNARQQDYTANIVKSSLALLDILNSWLQQAKNPSDQVRRPQPPAAAAVEAPVGPHADTPGKLLVVEDSSMIRDLFMDIFSEERFSILTASNGARALELACSELPQLIFLDLHLPDTDGWQVAKTLRHHPATAAIPLIAMTGQPLKPEEYRPCFDSFLQKPFQLKQLRSTVNAWLRPLPVNEAAAAAVPHEPGDKILDTSQQDLAHSLQPCWDVQMNRLLAAVSHTGRLSLALELGKYLQSTGREQKYSPMEQAGRQLVHCAAAPDIAGLEAMIKQLAPLLQGNQP